METILLVDDNTDIINALALHLKLCLNNPEILMAPNGQAGIDLLRQVQVDLIITDLQMPVMDGYALIEHRNNHFPSVAVIAMTGDTSPDVKKKLSGLGVHEHLEKPFDFDEVIRLIESKIAPQTAEQHMSAGTETACPVSRVV